MVARLAQQKHKQTDYLLTRQRGKPTSNPIYKQNNQKAQGLVAQDMGMNKSLCSGRKCERVVGRKSFQQLFNLQIPFPLCLQITASLKPREGKTESLNWNTQPARHRDTILKQVITWGPIPRLCFQNNGSQASILQAGVQKNLHWESFSTAGKDGYQYQGFLSKMAWLAPTLK